MKITGSRRAVGAIAVMAACVAVNAALALCPPETWGPSDGADLDPAPGAVAVEDADAAGAAGPDEEPAAGTGLPLPADAPEGADAQLMAMAIEGCAALDGVDLGTAFLTGSGTEPAGDGGEASRWWSYEARRADGGAVTFTVRYDAATSGFSVEA